ncbi:DUF58 domain-containing protein [Gorillibacterium sp. sgz5001074]|uniref:DUF58 domain-containing protein n=1 Tax=Gorillibacterium sp. sgz5001074 TaxID=3446695 RepID=UPI003F6621E5
MAWGRVYRLLIMSAMAAGAIALAYTRGGGSVWFLAMVLAGIWGLSAASLLFLMVRVRAVRTLAAETVAPGETLQAELKIRHTSLLPLLWVAVTDRWTRVQDGEEFKVTRLAYPGFSRSFTVRYRLSGLPRGEYRFEGTELVSGDLWGMAVKRRRIPLFGGFAVLPEVRPLAASPAPRDRGGEEPSLRLLFNGGGGVPGSTVRPYTRGDPLRSVHWRSTARTGELMTRAVEPAEESRYMIFLDADAGAYGGEAGALLFETGVEYAAGLLKLASDERLEAGLAVGGRTEVWLPPAVRPDFASSHRLLARVHPDGGPSLTGLLSAKGEELQRGAYTFVVITPALREETVEALARLRASNRPAAVLLLRAGALLSPAERERKRKLAHAGCPVMEAAPAARRRAVMLHADQTGA